MSIAVRVGVSSAVVLSVALAGIASAATHNYSSGSLHKPIPDDGLADNNGAVAKIKVPDGGDADDVDAMVRLNHARDQEIHIFLVSPHGTSIDLSSDNGVGGSESDYGTGPNSCKGKPTKFDDEAGTSIVNGDPPFEGSYSPEEPLSSFDGEKIKGAWKLKVFDDIHGDVGRLGCAKLRISR